jgi:hypothetical protein
MNVQEKFESIGAKLEVKPINPQIRTRATSIGRGLSRVPLETGLFVRMNIITKKSKEIFVVEKSDDAELEVLDIDKGKKHLLLMAKRKTKRGTYEKIKFLCGHDERHWFISQPDNMSVTNVLNAMESLKPKEVKSAILKAGIRNKNKNKRKNEAYERQGEWFFIPAPNYKPDPLLILKKEPLRRGRSKPHIPDFLVRTGGETVYVKNNRIISEKEYSKLPSNERIFYTAMKKDPTVYVKGKVRHPDHGTIDLRFWHEVKLNTEISINNIFLD